MLPPRLGPGDGEDLDGIHEPGLDEPRLLWPAASQFGHGAQHEEPVERFLVAMLFDILQRGLAPECVVPDDYGVEVEAVRTKQRRTSQNSAVAPWRLARVPGL